MRWFILTPASQVILVKSAEVQTPAMRRYRSRNENGELREKRGDTHVGTIEQKYGVDLGVRGDMHLDTKTRLQSY